MSASGRGNRPLANTYGVDPVHGMFSFLTAMPEGRTRGFPRPSIHLSEFCFTQNLWQGHKLTCDLDEETLHQLWGYLVAQVHDAGLVVGTHASLPTLERFRRMRHSAQYYDPDGPAITHDDAAWAISTAQSATEGTRRISEGGGLSRFELS